MIKRKVSFFHLSLSTGTSGTNVFIDQKNVETYFESIYNSIGNQQNGYSKCIPNGNNDIVVEVLDYDKLNHSAFLKIGYLNPPTIHNLRDYTTLETEKISMTTTQKVETFTCCYINFTTNIVSYINVMSAPRISTLKLFFDECLKEQYITSFLSSIMCSTDDLDLKNKRITKVEIVYAKPKNNVLADELGFKENEFDRVYNVQAVRSTHTIKAKRMESIFPDTQSFFWFWNRILNNSNNRPVKATATTKNETNTTHIIDLLQEQYAYTGSVSLDDSQPLDHTNTQTALINCTSLHIDHLIKHSPANTQNKRG